MKRFRFGLERLLRLKEQRERIAEVAVGQARQKMDQCQEQLTYYEKALSAVGRVMEQGLGSTRAAEEWVGIFEQANRLERAIRGAEDDLERAKHEFEEAVRARARISTEVEALETLREQHLDEYKQDQQLAEQLRLDELGMRQWSRGATDGGASAPAKQAGA